MTAPPTVGLDPALHAALAAPGRLRALTAYDLDDPALRVELDEVSRTTAQRLGATAGLVSFVLDTALQLGGQHGLPVEHWIVQSGGMPAEWSLCSEVTASGRQLRAPDLLVDPQYADSPLVAVEGVRSYAGVPLLTADGQVLGAHCVLSTEPRAYDDDDVAVLVEGARRVLEVLEDHRRR